MTKTLGTFFTGGDLFGIGAREAGLEPIWGIEKFDKIAAVARKNGCPCITADITEFDITQLPRPDHFHASPPCPNFSVAKNDGEEPEFDIAMAQATARGIRHFKSDSVTIENVTGYRNSQSFKIITQALEDAGYWFDVDNVNAADFGVPQTRIRMIIRARLGMMLHPYPHPEPWKGWYQAIEDLIPTLPDSEFAPWHLARLDAAHLKTMEIGDNFFIGGGNKSQSFLDFAVENRPTIPGIRNGHEPMMTVPADGSTNQAGRAFLTEPTKYNPDHARGKGYRKGTEPSQTVLSSNSR